MGRPYDEELALLPSTARWIIDFDINRALAALIRITHQNLVVVASGGSAVPAQLLAQVHMAKTGRLAVVMTPLEFIAEGPLSDTAVWFISAGGSNIDILRAWEEARLRAVVYIGLLCGSSVSPLAERAQALGLDSAVIFELPSGRDGFLATNSMIAFCILILRLYRISVPTVGLPSLDPRTLELLHKNTLVVLFGGWSKSIAIDIESRFTEAALGSVQISDYRNFAHGRHHWLAKRGSDTAILALVSPRYAAMAKSTLENIPAEVSTDIWLFNSDSPGAALLGLVKSMTLAQRAAQQLGYDAGRPGVPRFGHEIYDLNVSEEMDEPSIEKVAVGRKRRSCISAGTVSNVEVVEALARFRLALSSTQFVGVVLDYDGTVVETAKRFEPIESLMARAIHGILDQGLLLGIATGRGKSIHARLREVVTPQLWERVTIGYYNGGVLRSLKDGCGDLTESKLPAEIQEAAAMLESVQELAGACFEPRPAQITISSNVLDETDLWSIVKENLERCRLTSLKVVQSSHSIDIIPQSVSKLNVVAEIAIQAKALESSVLKIGDRGRWPGNDVELLGTTHGLSVDHVSSSTTSCWNLLPRGLGGPRGAAYYLSRMTERRYVE